MFHIIPTIAGTALACFIVREVRQTYREYPQIKQAIAQGDTQARERLYKKVLRFEWISAPLAIVALNFDKARLLASSCARRTTPAMSSPSTSKVWWRRFIPDIATLIPVTGRERWIFVAVALSAGVCEEIVFRGWLLSVLHNPVGLTGTALVLLAALIFGLCHIYQGPTGVFGATAAGVLLTGVYVMTGTLLVPIVLHALIDLRMAIVPSSAPQAARAQTA